MSTIETIIATIIFTAVWFFMGFVGRMIIFCCNQKWKGIPIIILGELFGPITLIVSIFYGWYTKLKGK